MKDFRGLPVSTGNSQALEHFEIALSQFQRYHGDPIATIEQAISLDP